MADEPPRSRRARLAAEQALVRVVHHYGETPEFVVLGGLVPELLCAGSGKLHAGTTDVDVQVDLEISAGAVNTTRLEHALANAEFVSTEGRVWRWQTDVEGHPAIIKFELLADIETEGRGAIIEFDACEALGAVNLPGTGFASRDYQPCPLRARIGGVNYDVEVNVTGLAGFLLAKAAAAYGRRKPKDWYDIAFVLQHNDAGGPDAAAEAVIGKFSDAVAQQSRTTLLDLRGNFETPTAQGPAAYAEQFEIDHPGSDSTELRADAVVAVKTFCSALGV